MDLGILETAGTLGLFKIVCSFLSLPTLRDSQNSVSFCCSCLVFFTDFSVTAFLAFLWLATPWQPRFEVSNDVIALRLLLFLDHTYGAVLLMTTPLVAVDTVCRALWPAGGCAEEDEDNLGDGDRKRSRGRGGVRWREWEEAGGEFYTGVPSQLTLAQVPEGGEGTTHKAEADTAVLRNEDGCAQGGSLQHVPGFLCCLLVWALCGVCGERDWRPERGLIEACAQRGDSLAVCLPDVFTVTKRILGNPSQTLGTLALSLALFLSRGIANRRLTHGQTDVEMDKRTDDVDGPRLLRAWPVSCTPVRYDTEAQWARSHTPSGGPAVHRLPPAYLLHVLHTCTAGPHASDPSSTPPHASTAAERGSHDRTAPSQGTGSPWTRCERGALAHAHAGHVVILLGACPPRSPCDPAGATGALDRTRPLRRPRGGVRLRGEVLTGVACVALLCLLPPALAVNTLLIRSVERLAERGLRHILSASH
ncbi:hypothetical protein MATL_G00113290 [Megalops atlanticus]|uniref:Uncharacterized protein n=1 Tax=Megalops atlanticus TaxID=7932 RepID=A0A9D3T9Q5_MEGAT|nr:hypothetical protein MATL_G00113290 [Megalops atlanticus]